jgi:Fe-S oxidoreductase
MAKMKVEFLAHYKKKHGFTLKDRLIAHLPDYADDASRFAFLLNLRDRLPGLAWLSEKITGFTGRRPLPRWRSDTFWAAHDAALFSGRAQTIAAAPKAAALFVDTFNGAFESENAMAAARVLKKAGYTLYLIGKDRGRLCCGRTYLSAGMVDKAREKLSGLLKDVLPLARAGVPIVGLEPSCLLTLRDEALAMGFGEMARTVSGQAFLLEEFLTREAKAGRFNLALKSAPAPILLHGHCHQKAFGAVAPVLDVLRLIPGAEPRLIETSCCGMAGSFGYDDNHYEISMRMAELSLLPAVRDNPDAIIVADGTSCRHQIAHGAGRPARHVAVLLDELS